MNRQKKYTSLDQLMEELDIDDHKIPIQELFTRLQANPFTGLTNAKASENLERNGPNKPTVPKPTPEWVKFFKCLLRGYSVLLWVGVIFFFVSGFIQVVIFEQGPENDFYYGVGLILLLIISAWFSYYQKCESSKIMESFQNIVPQYATCLRECQWQKLRAQELTVGDIIEVKVGNLIPADIRIIEGTGFKVDNSSLTGDSIHKSRSTDFSDENPMHTTNLAFFSTTPVEGSCKGVVIRIGDDTAKAHIAHLAAGLASGETPIGKEIYYFIDVIKRVAVFFGVVIFIVALHLGYHWLDASVFFLCIVIAIIPQGLFATVGTTCLTLSSKRMALMNCAFKSLEAVETLGSTSIICIDKTGTLTQNQMTVTHLCFDNQIFAVDTNQDQFGAEYDKTSEGFKALSRIAILCNRAEFESNHEVIGDATETALIKFMEQTLHDIQVYRNMNKKVYEVPFNSNNKYQVSIHTTNDFKDSRNLLVMKGALEEILDRCTTIYIQGKELVLDDQMKQAVVKVYVKLGSLGERVLGFCDMWLPWDKYPLGYQFDAHNPNFPLSGFRFVGLISMTDPPRAVVADAVAKCRVAGVKVIMTTGDHPITAKSIAKSVGIISEGSETVKDIAERLNIPISQVNVSDANAVVIHGNELKKLDSDQLSNILITHKEIVFARVSPQQKVLIVERCQRIGAIVAVIGDGANDAPALKKADIGIAMGKSGSYIANEAADMILLDYNFSSIVTGIAEGRLIFENLKKSISYALTSRISEILPFLLFLLFNIPFPVGFVTILCIHLVTHLVPAISLAFEDAEPGIMKRQPRDPLSDKLLNHRLISLAIGQMGMIQAASGLFTYLVVMAENGFMPGILFGLRKQWDSQVINDLEDSYGQEWNYSSRKELEYTCYTAYFVSIVVVQWANLIICRTWRNSIFRQGMRNWVLNFALVFETCLAAALSFAPGVGTTFRMYPVKFNWWIPAIPFSIAIIAYDEFRKLILRRYPGGWIEQETHC